MATVVDIVGVRFRRAGRVYYFDPAGLPLNPDDLVVVETSRGTEIGQVVLGPKQVIESELTEPLKPVLRQAEAKDLRQMEYFKNKEKDVLAKCEEKVVQFNLPMKLISAEYSFDGSRLTFYFTAEGRVDFRDLVRELASTFRTRIELRQIGARDAAKLMGGLGRCGRGLCCATFLSDFAPVSIKMAKDQDLPLNPMKISGVCGRLLCCLGHENELYCEKKQKLPKSGDHVISPLGPARVVGVNVLKETVLLQMESQATVELPVSQITFNRAEPRPESPRAAKTDPQTPKEQASGKPSKDQQNGNPSMERQKRRKKK